MNSGSDACHCLLGNNLDYPYYFALYMLPWCACVVRNAGWCLLWDVRELTVKGHFTSDKQFAILICYPIPAQSVVLALSQESQLHTHNSKMPESLSTAILALLN